MKKTSFVRCLVPFVTFLAALLVFAACRRGVPSPAGETSAGGRCLRALPQGAKEGAEEGAKPVNDAFRTRAEGYMAHGAADSAVMCADTFMIKTVRSMDTATDARFAGARRSDAADRQPAAPGSAGPCAAVIFCLLLSVFGAVALGLRRHRRNIAALVGQYREVDESLRLICDARSALPGDEHADLRDRMEWHIDRLCRQKEKIGCRLDTGRLVLELTHRLQDTGVIGRLRAGGAASDPGLWAELARQVERHAAGAARLVDHPQQPLKETERRLCHLLLCGFAPQEMARLLNCSPQNVSSMRSRLGLKVFGRDMKAREFDRHFIAATVGKTVADNPTDL